MFRDLAGALLPTYTPQDVKLAQSLLRGARPLALGLLDITLTFATNIFLQGKYRNKNARLYLLHSPISFPSEIAVLPVLALILTL